MKRYTKILLIFLSLFVYGCANSEDTKKQNNDTANQTNQNKKIVIEPYFSKTSGSYYDNGVDQLIIEDIKKANKSINIMIYNWTNKYLKDAIIYAKNKGIKVKIYTDDQEINNPIYKQLIDSGIEVSSDQDSDAIMHNKVLIVDDNIVWSGSGNWTVYSFYRNFENYIKIVSKDINQIYQDKFDNLYQNSSKRSKSYKDENIEIYFSPEHNIEDILINNIQKATKSIKVMVFSFTNSLISKSLIDAKNRGVDVKIIIDDKQHKYQKYSKYDQLLSSSIEIKLDSDKQKMHNKVIILDDNIVITGSYNYTNKANDTNDENIVVIKDKNISKVYKDEFKKIYND